MNLFNSYKIIEEQSDLKAVKIEVSKDTSERVDAEIKKAFQRSQETVVTISGIKPIDANTFKRILQNEYIRDDADGNSNYIVECIIERLDNMPSLCSDRDTFNGRWVLHRRDRTYNRSYICSICNYEITVDYIFTDTDLPITCPYCKTRMGGVIQPCPQS